VAWTTSTGGRKKKTSGRKGEKSYPCGEDKVSLSGLFLQMEGKAVREERVESYYTSRERSWMSGGKTDEEKITIIVEMDH